MEDEPVEAVEHEMIPEAEEENEIVEVEDGTVEKDDAAEDETPGPVIETTDSSSATEDGLYDEPDEAAFRIAENLSEEVCDLQLQNELLMAKNHQLQKEDATLKAQLYHSSHYTTAIENAYTKTITDNMSLTSSVKSCYFTADYIFKDDAKTQFYTGLPSYDAFEALFLLLKNNVKRSITNKCTIKDEFMVTLAKLKLGLTNQDIAYHTNLSVNKVSPIFHRWLDIMYRELRQLIAWPERERLYETMPASFKKHYFHLIAIIDCFEIFTEKSASLEPRSATYSQYKKQHS